MKVKLLYYTPEPERCIAAAAKLCYSDSSALELDKSLSEEEIGKFLGTLMRVRHYSPFEHASFTFAIDGVSRALSHQLVRHRIASYSQQSQRYVKLDRFEYVIPPDIASDQRARDIFISAMERDSIAYDELVGILSEKHYKSFIDEGIEEKKARKDSNKLAIEDARYVFPNACETKIVVTMNAAALLNFFKKRCCERAQWEIRGLAIKMLDSAKKVAPNIFKKAGPSCVSGTCSEGEMTCGGADRVREFFLERRNI